MPITNNAIGYHKIHLCWPVFPHTRYVLIEDFSQRAGKSSFHSTEGFNITTASLRSAFCLQRFKLSELSWDETPPPPPHTHNLYHHSSDLGHSLQVLFFFILSPKFFKRIHGSRLPHPPPPKKHSLFQFLCGGGILGTARSILRNCDQAFAAPLIDTLEFVQPFSSLSSGSRLT